MAVSRPAIVLVLLTVLWAAIAVVDSQRLMSGYMLAASFQGEAPITERIEFALSYKLAVVLLSVGVVVGSGIALLKRSEGFYLSGTSAVALLAVGIWSVKKYGTLGAPVSSAQIVTLAAIAYISYRACRWSKNRKDEGNAT